MPEHAVNHCEQDYLVYRENYNRCSSSVFFGWSFAVVPFMCKHLLCWLSAFTQSRFEPVGPAVQKTSFSGQTQDALHGAFDALTCNFVTTPMANRCQIDQTVRIIDTMVGKCFKLIPFFQVNAGLPQDSGFHPQKGKCKILSMYVGRGHGSTSSWSLFFSHGYGFAFGAQTATLVCINTFGLTYKNWYPYHPYVCICTPAGKKTDQVKSICHGLHPNVFAKRSLEHYCLCICLRWSGMVDIWAGKMQDCERPSEAVEWPSWGW